VQALTQIETDEGFPASFAADWGLPGTAIYGTPNNQDNGIPGEPMSSPGIVTGSARKSAQTPAKPNPNPPSATKQ
jgi:hypothetical protein